MLLSTLLKELNYEQSPHYRSHVSEFEPETAHLFRAVVLRLETKSNLDRPRLLCLDQRLQSLRRVSVLGFHGGRFQFRSG